MNGTERGTRSAAAFGVTFLLAASLGQVYNGYETRDARSPYGLYDMAGNVWQWVRDVTEGTHDRYLRGGSKADYDYNLRIWTRNSARPDYTSPNAGFRCVR
jgi:formylglycine-generating enzyme